MSRRRSPFAFDPVPLARTRHDGWLPKKQKLFIAKLAETGLIAQAAHACGMSAKSAYALRKRPGAQSFAKAWDKAAQAGQLRARETLVDVALEEIRVPIMRNGKQVGERVKTNHRALFAAVRSFYPRVPMPRLRMRF